MRWTVEQALALAPNTATTKRAQSLAKPNKWHVRVKDERVIWGLCHSSGKQAYKVQIDLQGPAFKCSCPSRQFPCKHALGLLIMYAENPHNLQKAERADWVEEWMAKRDKTATKKEDTRSPEELQKSIDARKKREEKRLILMRSGLEEIEHWLSDLIRSGLVTVEHEKYKFWEDRARSMVDSKLSGVAKIIKEIPLLIGASDDWYKRVLARLSEIYLLAQSYKHLEKLPEAVQEDLKTIGGINKKKEEVIATEKGIKDTWRIIGHLEFEEDGLQVRRVWIQGVQTLEFGLILDYAPIALGGTFNDHWMVGMEFEGTIVYYPSNYPMRCIVKEQATTKKPIEILDGAEDFDVFLEGYSKAIAKNPFLVQYPCALEAVIPVLQGNKLFLLDEQKRLLPVQNKDLVGWQLMALSGGKPIRIFGEWTGEILLPLGAFAAERFIAVN